MRTPRDKKQAPGGQREDGQEEEATEATREDVVTLIDQFRAPHERLYVDDWPGVAKALVRAARCFGLEVPHYLAWSAGFREPPPPLRLVRGGKGDVVTGNETTTERSRSSSAPIQQEDPQNA